jgi:hypothetical protein
MGAGHAAQSGQVLEVNLSGFSEVPDHFQERCKDIGKKRRPPDRGLEKFTHFKIHSSGIVAVSSGSVNQIMPDYASNAFSASTVQFP